MRGVNMVLVEEKYFWKMYDSNMKNTLPLNLNLNLNLQPDSSPGQQSGINAGKVSGVNRGIEVKEVSKSPGSARSMARDSTINAKAAEYIEMPSMGSNGNVGGEKKFTFYRNVEMTYSL
jgi:hypothetical protein